MPSQVTPLWASVWRRACAPVTVLPMAHLLPLQARHLWQPRPSYQSPGALCSSLLSVASSAGLTWRFQVNVLLLSLFSAWPWNEVPDRSAYSAAIFPPRQIVPF